MVRALVAWAIYKIRRVLVDGQAGVGGLRTECKFTCESITSNYIESKTGKKKDKYSLSDLERTLTDDFAPLRKFKEDMTPDEGIAITKVRWVPKIEGKVEVPEDLKGSIIVLPTFSAEKAEVANVTPKATKRNPNPKPKLYLILKGEWTAEDKNKLRELNPSGASESSEAKRSKLVEDAISDYEKQWTAKAQGGKAADEEDAGEPND